MLYELAQEDYPRVHALVAGLTAHLSVTAVIEGSVAGEVWVDDARAPQATFIMTPEGQYLAGDPAIAAFQQALSDRLLTIPTVNVTYSPDTWESTFPTLLACKFARPYARRYYTFSQLLLTDWRARLPLGYEMVRVDPAFLARHDLAQLGDVRERVDSWTDFARDGFGFCLLHDDTIVAHCLADCVSGSRCELGVFTDRDYRRLGLGALTVAATVEHCLERRLPSIGWHCWANNRGSQRVAEKVGFELAGAYTQYANSAAAENPDDLTPAAWQAEGDFFGRALEILSESAKWMAWRAAKARALAGEHAQALTLLQRLAESGAMPPGWERWLEEGWEFASLRHEREWVALLECAQRVRSPEGEVEG
jgi:RimJ/RimL family protein N-acetyltransferase